MVELRTAPGYCVDSDGRVWSLQPGRCGRYRAPHEVRSHRDRRGYVHVSLRPLGRRKRFAVAALVAEAFLGPRPLGAVVAHLDGDCANNGRDNLAYVTQRENVAHRWQHGTMICGEQSHLAHLSDETAREIWAAIQSGARCAEVRRRFGVSEPYYYAMKTGRIRRHITGLGLPAASPHT